MKRGYIKLFRKVRDSDLWFENRRGKERRASKFEAWIDLVITANHKEGKIAIGDNVFHLQRGELVASVRFLAKRWHWSKSAVSKFLKRLEFGAKVVLKRVHGINHITISNYSTYNDAQNTSVDDQWTDSGHKRDKCKNVEEVKNEKKEDTCNVGTRWSREEWKIIQEHIPDTLFLWLCGSNRKNGIEKYRPVIVLTAILSMKGKYDISKTEVFGKVLFAALKARRWSDDVYTEAKKIFRKRSGSHG